MIFVGFRLPHGLPGQRHGFSSVGFTFLLAAFALQWSTLIQGSSTPSVAATSL